mmetsp:Transcript_15870/g.18152  ORF Transcript_15870/g.18152 Transcript_15870/m.18152 type:complete len:97 (+) Transcript_15870:226-516(+)
MNPLESNHLPRLFLRCRGYHSLREIHLFFVDNFVPALTAPPPPPEIMPKKNPTMLERTDKNFIHCMYDKYSMSQQKNRILIAESLFQAAISQASDP